MLRIRIEIYELNWYQVDRCIWCSSSQKNHKIPCLQKPESSCITRFPGWKSKSDRERIECGREPMEPKKSSDGQKERQFRKNAPLSWNTMCIRSIHCVIWASVPKIQLFTEIQVFEETFPPKSLLFRGTWDFVPFSTKYTDTQPSISRHQFNPKCPILSTAMTKPSSIANYASEITHSPEMEKPFSWLPWFQCRFLKVL